MKNLKSLIFTLIVITGLLSFNSCDVTNIDDIAIQMTFNFDPLLEDEPVPDSSVDFTNLNTYQEYRENKDQIENVTLLHFNYSISNIETEETGIILDSLVFKSVNFYLIPATINGNRVPGERYKLAEVKNLRVSDYYKTAKHIITVSDEVGTALAKHIKNGQPYFIFVTEYSGLVGDEPNLRFEKLEAHVDLVARVVKN